MVLVAGAPWWLWRMATTQKYREGLAERLGRVHGFLKGQGDRPLIWVHAVSVGEVLAVSRLVKTLDAELPEYFVADFHHYPHRPGAGPRTLRRQPGLLLPAGSALGCARLSQRPQAKAADPGRDRILAESAQRLLSPQNPRGRGECAHLRPILAALPSAASFWRPLLERLSRVLAQSEIDAESFESIGCRPERVSVAGNLKFDVRAAQ